MNIIFLTMSSRVNVNIPGIYSDLMRKCRDEGHDVYIVNPRQRCTGERTQLCKADGVHYLGVKTLNVTGGANVIEKGVGQISVESLFKRAIKRYLGHVKFNLILYSTPPVTFTKVIKYLKASNPQAMTYLLLKDIFPQNAVDLGMMVASPKPSPQGKGLLPAVINVPKYWLYEYFRNKEKNLYALSDYIGCMSPANVQYVIKHNPEVNPDRVEVAPNSIELNNETQPCDEVSKREIRQKYGLPVDKPIFIYGGNLGKPQGIPFLIQCLDANASRSDCHFVVVGNGTERAKLDNWYHSHGHNSVTLLNTLPKDDYDMLVRSCDIGLIFLDYHFTIPNYPSRLLPYLENRMPIIASTDPNCDTGSIAEQNGYGYWCPSNDVNAFTDCVEKMLHSDIALMGQKGYEFLKQNYLVEHTYNAIMRHV